MCGWEENGDGRAVDGSGMVVAGIVRRMRERIGMAGTMPTGVDVMFMSMEDGARECRQGGAWASRRQAGGTPDSRRSSA